MNRPRVRAAVSTNCVALSALTLVAVMLAACQLPAQSPSPTPEASMQSTQSQAGTSSQSAAPDERAQMRTNLDRMESLLGNMSSEIEFLRDQNLQILLRTNSQMWTILIRDLRRQIDREEQQRSRMPQPESGPTAPKPTPR